LTADYADLADLRGSSLIKIKGDSSAPLGRNPGKGQGRFGLAKLHWPFPGLPE
jgi:hypothetical protein